MEKIKKDAVSVVRTEIDQPIVDEDGNESVTDSSD